MRIISLDLRMKCLAEKTLRAEIQRREAELQALRNALDALTDGKVGKARGKGLRRPRTAAEKAALSKAMKAAWMRRKSAAGASAAGRKGRAAKAR